MKFLKYYYNFSCIEMKKNLAPRFPGLELGLRALGNQVLCFLATESAGFYRMGGGDLVTYNEKKSLKL